MYNKKRTNANTKETMQIKKKKQNNMSQVNVILGEIMA